MAPTTGFRWNRSRAFRGMAVLAAALFTLSACEDEPDLEDRPIAEAETRDTITMGADRDELERERESELDLEDRADLDRRSETELGEREDLDRRSETELGDREGMRRPAEPMTAGAAVAAMSGSELERLDSLIERTLEDLRRAQQLIREARSAQAPSTDRSPSGQPWSERDTLQKERGTMERSSLQPASQDTARRAGSQEVTVELSEFQIEMEDSIPAGQVTFKIENVGTVDHNFEIEGQGIEKALESNLAAGEEATMEVELEPGTYRVYCPVANHADRGMSMQLTVTAEEPTRRGR